MSFKRCTLLVVVLLLTSLTGCVTLHKLAYSSREYGYVASFSSSDAERVAEFLQYVINNSEEYADDTGDVLYTPNLHLRPIGVHYMFFYPPGEEADLYKMITQHQLPNTVAVEAFKQLGTLDASQSRLLVVYEPTRHAAEVSVSELPKIMVRQLSFARIEIEFKASLVLNGDIYRLRSVFSYKEHFPIGS